MEFLAQARLIEPYLQDEEYTPQYQPTLAALLAFGETSAIDRYFPASETVVVAGNERFRMWKNVIESVLYGRPNVTTTDGDK
jgi:hypothetical protein